MIFFMQRKREVAYFIVVLHDLKSVLIAVRGTETPEDLITDGLCRECNLSEDDLDGLVKKVSPPPLFSLSLNHLPQVISLFFLDQILEIVKLSFFCL